MKTKIALLLLAAALLPACQTTKRTAVNRTETHDYKGGRYANVSRSQDIAPPAEGPVAESPAPPSEGPLEDVAHNPAVVPTPLLRNSAAASP